MTSPPRQQTKNPTSMRYQRVQALLEAEDYFRGKLGPKTFAIENRFNNPILVSEEAAKVTDALHAQGKDAHKVPKIDVLIAARKVLDLSPNGSNGDAKALSSPVVAPIEPAKAPEARKPKTAPVKAPPKQQVKPQAKPVATKPKAKAQEPKKQPPQPPKKASKQKAPQPEQKTVPKVKAQPVQAEAAPVNNKPVEEDQVPESELPPEQQPLRLPPDFDYRQYPHYSVQSSIYSLLLSALNMSEHYEKFPGLEERQKDIESLVKKYQDTCDPLKLKT